MHCLNVVVCLSLLAVIYERAKVDGLLISVELFNFGLPIEDQCVTIGT